MKNFASNPKSINLLVLLALACICTAVYFNALNNSFVIDDYPLIVDNPSIKNIEFFPKIFFVDSYHFTNSVETKYYRPLLLTSYAIDYAIWGLNPSGFHLTNIFIHILNGYLIFLLLNLLFKHAHLAFGTALIFCIHPIQTSAVTYISGRADLLCAFFMLLGLYFLLYYFKSKRLYSYFLTLISVIAALLSRETGLLFPLLALLVIIHHRPSWKIALLSLSGILAIIYFYFINRIFIVPAMLQTCSAPISPLPFFIEALNILNILKQYVLLIFFPYPLYMMKATPVINTFSISIIVFIVSLSILISAAIKHRLRIVVFGVLWSLISFLPLFITIYFYPSMGLMMAEHWLYMPSIGIFIILIYYLLSLKIKYTLWLILLSSAFGLSTIVINQTWKDDITLSRHTLEFAPNNAVSYLELASAYYRLGQYDNALSTLAYLSSPEPILNLKIQNMLGHIYEAKGDLNKAILCYQKVIKIRPKDYLAHYYLGRIYLSLGNIPDAFRYFSKAWENNPSSDLVYLGWGDFYNKLGYHQKALFFYENGLKINPYNNNLILRAASSLEQMGMYQEACRLLETILANKNITPEDIKNVGNIYADMANFPKAISLWQEAIEKNPNDQESRANIQKALGLQKLST